MNNSFDKLTSAEIAKLWVSYLGNTKSICVLSYFLQHVDDIEIKMVLTHALNLSTEFVETTQEIYLKENIPFPKGFTEEDVNLGAPRLFLDEFYLHYLKYAGKAGISLYGVAIPLVVRLDIRDFFTKCLDSTVKLTNQVNDLLMKKGLLEKSPYIPIPETIDFVKKHHYMNGFLGNLRPLSSIEITHLYDIVQSNTTSKNLLIGFTQVARREKIRDHFIKGKTITHKHIQSCSKLLQNENLPAPALLDHLVTTSTFSPFSDKLMLQHKIDMFAMKIRYYGNALAVSARHDIGAMYIKFLMNIGMFLEGCAETMIDHGWLEQPPGAVDRDTLASE
jgi:spore coat protein CotF